MARPYTRRRRRRAGPVWVWALGFLILLVLLVWLIFGRGGVQAASLTGLDPLFTAATVALGKPPDPPLAVPPSLAHPG